MDEASHLAEALIAHRGDDAVPELTDAVNAMAGEGHAQAAILWYDVLVELLRLTAEKAA